MTQAPFGRSGPGLLQRLRPSRITVPDLRDTADAVLPELAGRGLRIAVLDRPTGGAVLVLGLLRLCMPRRWPPERPYRGNTGSAGATPSGTGVRATFMIIASVP